MTRIRLWFAIAGLAVGYGLFRAFTSPVDVVQGEYTRLINIHVPSLWLAFLAFAVTAFGSIMWLRKKTNTWDAIAAASAEVGVLFTGIGLFTGMVWGKAVWGRAWDWGDQRLATTAVMFFVYLAYLALRRATPDREAKARRSAMLGAVAVVQVPLVYFSVILFRTLHQGPSLRPDGASMPSEMLQAMLVNVLAFTVLYVALMKARLSIPEDDSVEAAAGATNPQLSEISDV